MLDVSLIIAADASAAGSHSIAQMTFFSRRCDLRLQLERKWLFESHSCAGQWSGRAFCEPER
eukprot:1610397-Prymnesium_polylepis.1